MRHCNGKHLKIHKSELKEINKRFEEVDYLTMSRKDIIESSMGWVWEIAYGFSLDEKASGVLNLQDLIQFGYIGLIEAVDKLDMEKLQSVDNPDGMVNDYVRKRIWGSIRRGINQGRSQMKISEYAITQANKGKKREFVEAFFNAVFSYLGSDKQSSSKFYLEIEDKSLEYDANFVHQYLVGLINKYLDIDEATCIRKYYGLGTDVEGMGKICVSTGLNTIEVYNKINSGVEKLKGKVDPDYVTGFMNE